MKGKHQEPKRKNPGQRAPLISIVIPTKDSAKTLALCFESLNAQAFRDFEIIIVDKSSKDGTKEMAEASGAKYIVSLCGLPAARNLGFSQAKGKILMSIDSDMVLENGLLKEVASKMSGPDAYDALILTEVGYGTDFISRCKDLEKRCYIGDELIESARAFTRRAFDASGGYNPELHFGEDWDFYMRLKPNLARIGRTDTRVLHNTRDVSMLSNLRKSYLYGRTLTKYVRKNPTHASLWWSPSRFFFYKNLMKLMREPVHGAGLVLIKGSEYAAGCAGFMAEKLGNLRNRSIMNQYLSFIRIVIAFENWQEFSRGYVGLPSSTDVLRLRNGITVKIHPSEDDLWPVSEVWAHNAYLPAGFSIHKGDTVIDIGAHIGSFSLLAASRAKGVRVISLEPFPASFNMLKENIRSNSFNTIEPIGKGVMAKRGKVKLNIRKGSSCCNSMFASGGDSIEVECITLADVFRERAVERCHMLKLDCEGAEYGILMGAEPSLLARIDSIVMEYHDSFVGFDGALGKDENHIALKSFLEGQGFAVNVKPPMMYAKRAKGKQG